MASNKDTKDLAKELGLHVPDSLSDEEQMKLIADQLGVKDFKPSEKNNNDLYNILKDKKLKVKVPVQTITVVNGITTETPIQEPKQYETLYDNNNPETQYTPSKNQPSSKSNAVQEESPKRETLNEEENNPSSDKTEEQKPNDQKNNEQPENADSKPSNNDSDNKTTNDETTAEQGTDNITQNSSDNEPQNNQEENNNGNPNSEDNNNKNDEQNAKNQTENKPQNENNESSEGEKKENTNSKQEETSPEKKNPENNNKEESSPEKKDNNQQTEKRKEESKTPEKPSSNNSVNQNDTLKNKVGKKNEVKNNSDITKNGRKNIEQAKKAKNATKKAPTPKKEINKKAKESGKKAARAIGNGLKTAAKAVAGFVKNTLIPFIMSNPWLLAVFALVLFLAIILIVILMGADPKTGHNTGYQGTQCSYDLNGVVNTGNVSLNDVVVELINCDGRPNNYTVLETVDFEKYALGVALAQMGEDAPDEAIKAQIIVARNFALTRNSTMCAEDPENCFYGYNISTGKIRMRACDLDQVYWDYEKSIYTDESSGVKKYSPEATSETGLLWKTSLTGERRDEVLALAREVKGKVLLDNEDKVLKISSSLAAVNNIFSLAYEGKVYEEILASSYGSNNVNSSVCSSVGNIDFGDYNLNSDGDSILHKNLATFLSEQGTSLEEFNNIIAKNVNNSGYGTRAGVVAAAVTLVAELGNKYDAKIPYFWGGGHSGGISEYADPTWGSNSCHIYANSQNYNYCGLDCTGFVSWAIHNGGYNLNSARGNFYKMDGARKVNLKDDEAVLQAGDLLESKSHVVMVIGVDNDRRQYICVEASGNEDGIWFTRRSFSPKGYWGVLMDDYYNDGSNVRS